MKKPRISEASIQRAVLQHWNALGLPNTLVAAIPNAHAWGQPGLTRGLFDLLCIGPRGVGFLELKADGCTLRPEQETFCRLLILHGVDYAVTYGRDEPIQVITDWGICRPTKVFPAATRSGCAGEVAASPSIPIPRVPEEMA